MLLDSIHSPADVRALPEGQLPQLCQELREFLVKSVSQTGGHLASNLGAVELTVAIHRVFDTERDRLVFDVGHQCYVHKMLTGRRERFATLRQLDGLSGFPKPHESVHDAFIAGHASNSVSVALGMARARTLGGEDYRVLALIGDGALTGGLAYEGLNNAGASGEPLIVILNDNGMSINPNVGAMPSHLARLRSRPGYYHFKKWYRSLFGPRPMKNLLYRFNHKVKTFLKRNLFPGSTLFEDMGFTYLGPVDGHDLPRLCDTLDWARELDCPVVVHVNTVKGKGWSFAERNPDMYHGVGPFDLESGLLKKAGEESFSSVFGKALADFAREDSRVCAVTAAMADGTGLSGFAKTFPDRFFDVGIAEGHGVSMAAGMAARGLLPVFAVYSTFLQRSYDMLIHDVALEQLHVVLGVDRAGLVGADGETHHGCFDPLFLPALPGYTVLCPASFAELRRMLRRAPFGAQRPGGRPLSPGRGGGLPGGCLGGAPGPPPEGEGRHLAGLRHFDQPDFGGGGAPGTAGHPSGGFETEPDCSPGQRGPGGLFPGNGHPIGAGGLLWRGLRGPADRRHPGGRGPGSPETDFKEPGPGLRPGGQRPSAGGAVWPGRRRRGRGGGGGVP